MFELSFSLVMLFLLLCLLSGKSTCSPVVICNHTNVDPWNTDYGIMKISIKKWLKDGVNVNGKDMVSLRLFHQFTDAFTKPGKYSEYDRVGDLDNTFIAEKTYHKDNNDFVDEYPFFNENDRSVVTIGKFCDNIPSGLVWQWRSRRFEDGFLYGQVNNEGIFSGNNITYIYPDLSTGLRGKFVNGNMIAAIEVKIMGERCNGGIKELRIKTMKKRKDIVWKRENLNASYIGRHPNVRDPFERRSTYIGQSSITGSGEGVFAKRDFLPGELVMYFSGKKMYIKDIVPYDEMDHEEIEIAQENFIQLELPGFPEHLGIDQPPGYRHVKDYRTTLGHKVNHNFVNINTFTGFVRHPSHGPIISLIAIKPIAKGEEIFYNYQYNLNTAPKWYKEYKKLINPGYGNIDDSNNPI